MLKIVSKLLVVLSVAVLLSSCLSTNVPKKLKRASKKLEKHLDVVDDIVDKYPSLMDSLTVVSHDTIIVESHSIDTSYVPTIDTNKIDSLIFNAIGDMAIFQEEQPLIRATDREIARVRTIRNLIIKEVLKDTTIVFEDSLLLAGFSVKDGTYVFNYTLKRKKIPYVKQETTLNPKVIHRETPIWKNFWFWLMLLIIILLIVGRFKR